MARKVIITDDLNNDVEATQHIEYAIDGVSYIIDLCDENADKFKAAMKPWIEVSTRQKTKRPITSSGLSRAELADLRRWAEANGITVSTRGRVSQEILTAYHAKDASALHAKKVTTAMSRAAKKVQE